MLQNYEVYSLFTLWENGDKYTVRATGIKEIVRERDKNSNRWVAIILKRRYNFSG